MKQNNQRNRNRRPGFLPWMILGIAVLIVIGAIIIIPASKDESPPQPVGEWRVSRVNLTVQSNVGGAEVYLDAQPKGITSDTHYKATLFNLAPKAYQITLKKQGYVDQTESIEVTGQAISQRVRIDMDPGGIIE